MTPDLKAICEKILELDAKATQGEWMHESNAFAYENQVYVQFITGNNAHHGKTLVVSSYKMRPNGDFITFTRNHSPLLAKVLLEIIELYKEDWHEADYYSCGVEAILEKHGGTHV